MPRSRPVSGPRPTWTQRRRAWAPSLRPRTRPIRGRRQSLDQGPTRRRPRDTSLTSWTLRPPSTPSTTTSGSLPKATTTKRKRWFLRRRCLRIRDLLRQSPHHLQSQHRRRLPWRGLHPGQRRLASTATSTGLHRTTWSVRGGILTATRTPGRPLTTTSCPCPTPPSATLPPPPCRHPLCLPQPQQRQHPRRRPRLERHRQRCRQRVTAATVARSKTMAPCPPHLWPPQSTPGCTRVTSSLIIPGDMADTSLPSLRTTLGAACGAIGGVTTQPIPLR